MKFEYTYKTLPKELYHPSQAEAFSHPQLIKFNHELSQELGLNFSSLSDKDLSHIFSGQTLLEGCSPFSMAYAGHQFGHFVPQLGDGRAMILGEVKNPQGKRFDLQLKGAGRTIYSRNGDGKSPLGPVLREYIVSEAMHHLGVPTTRALAVVFTGDKVYRETPLPGAIFTRVASGHIRIGTFQYLAARGDQEGLNALLHFSLKRHFPELMDQRGRAISFFRRVVQRQVKLVAHWMSLGFIHGVMNTDNMTISGETIDYGPCAFMDKFNFNQVYSFIDRQGRYAYGNQPSILMWNLARLADCLIPLIDSTEKEALEALNHELSLIPDLFKNELKAKMISKFGVREDAEIDDILNIWFEYLQKEQLDFTESFRKLSALALEDDDFFPKTDQLNQFESLWRPRLLSGEDIKQKLDAVNPIFIPRNHQIERAIERALQGDYSLFHQLNNILSKPFTERAEYLNFSRPPSDEEKIQNTFCGT